MRSRYIKWLATEVLCLMKEDRMSRMNVEVGVPPHPQMKTTVLDTSPLNTVGLKRYEARTCDTASVTLTARLLRPLNVGGDHVKE
ncbi:hypothetical protein TNCV_1101481 [Trichonephila clavipes]|nr:hypothetical protein TNCV_1101481 [Trichonephila clavipes]